MFIKRSTVIGLVLMLALIGVLTACSTSTTQPSTTAQSSITAQPSTTAQSSITAQPSTTVQPSTTAQPSTTSTTSESALDQVIAGAKKEGTVSVQLAANLTSDSILQVQNAIKQTYGVTLKINFQPSGNTPQVVAQAILAHQSGATPSFDLLMAGADQIIPGLKAGVFANVDWGSLISPDEAAKELVSVPAYGISDLTYFSSLNGIIYNPDKIAAADAPKTVSDLANPKWQGKIGIPSYPTFWAGWTYFFGQNNTLSEMQAILNNGATKDIFSNEMNDYLLGENWIDVIGSSFYQEISNKGMPVKWQNPGAVVEEKYMLMELAGAAHPDAAELVAIYLASQAGTNLLANIMGNSVYPGNYAYDIVQQGKQQGLPYYFYGDPKYLDFVSSSNYGQMVNQITSILQNTK